MWYEMEKAQRNFVEAIAAKAALDVATDSLDFVTHGDGGFWNRRNFCSCSIFCPSTASTALREGLFFYRWSFATNVVPFTSENSMGQGIDVD